MAGAHTWISESSAPNNFEPRFEDGGLAGAATAFLSGFRKNER